VVEPWNACIVVCVWNCGCCGEVARLVTLAQAILTRVGETCISRPGLHSNFCSGGELLFWARHYLTQARDVCLCENAWKPWCAAAVLAQARNPTFGRGVVSLRRGKARLSKCAKSLLGPLSRSCLSESLQLERRDSSRLSEGFRLKRDPLQASLFSSLGCYGLFDWLNFSI